MKKFRVFPLLLLLCLAMSLIAPAAAALDDPLVAAQAVILLNEETGEILYEKNADERRTPASLTKMMTGLLLCEAVESGRVNLDDAVAAGLDCQNGLVEGATNASIVSGEVMTLKDLFYCAMVASANDACNVIGSYLSGSIDAFVDEMNDRAAALGCRDTHFVDPNGLSSMDVGHYTTARDLSLIAREAMSHHLFADAVNTATYSIAATNATPERHLANSNALISIEGIYGSGYIYEGASGIKTGYTRAAGYCLASCVERNDIRLLAIVMGCDGPNNSNSTQVGSFVATKGLYDWVYNNFSRQLVLAASEPVQQVTVENGQEDSIILHPEHDVTLLLPNDTDLATREMQVSIDTSRLVAPIAAGADLGSVTITVGGKAYGPIPLVTNTGVELSRSVYIRARIGDFFNNRWVRALIWGLVIFAVLYIILVLRYRALRRRHLREQKARIERRRRQQEAKERRAAQPPSRTQRFAAASGESREIDLEELRKYFGTEQPAEPVAPADSEKIERMVSDVSAEQSAARERAQDAARSEVRRIEQSSGAENSIDEAFAEAVRQFGSDKPQSRPASTVKVKKRNIE